MKTGHDKVAETVGEWYFLERHKICLARNKMRDVNLLLSSTVLYELNMLYKAIAKDLQYSCFECTNKVTTLFRVGLQLGCIKKCV